MDDLDRLLNDVNECLQEIGILENEPVRWKEVRCVEASVFRSPDGESAYSAVIAYASPSCERLPVEVSELLRRRGWGYVSVRTEW